MTNDINKKDLISKYKMRKVIGGIYAIKNIRTGKMLLDGTTDLLGMKNRFEFSQKTGSCINTRIQNAWKEDGHLSFEFWVLEELEKKEEQTMTEFRDDINVLKEIWLEKTVEENLY